MIRATLRGCYGGFVATVVMTVYRIPIFRALPPTAEFWARFVGGGDAEQYPLQGLVLHAVYGVVAGAIYGGLYGFLGRTDSASRERASLISGLGYGLVLSAVGARIVFERVLGRELASEDALVFHVGHAVYGVTLGTWMASRERRGEVYHESEKTRPRTEKQRDSTHEASPGEP